MTRLAHLPRNLGWSAYAAWHARRETALPFWAPERLERLQRRRVRRIVEHAYRTVPFYRDVMREAGLRPEELTSAADLARLPLVTREQLAAEPERLLSSRFTDEDTVTCLTSGTSGINRRIRYDPASLFLALAAGHRDRITLRRFCGRATGVTQVIYGSPRSSHLHLREFYESHSWVPRGIDNRRHCFLSTGPLEEHAERLNRIRPDQVGGYGGFIGALFRQLHDSGLSFHRPAVVLFWGEAIPESDRRLIEDELGCVVFGSYTATEALRLASQCELRGGYHVAVDQVAVRVIDEAGAEVPPGVPGELVVSNLTNRATVLLNYRLGDIVTMAAERCPCGRTLPLIATIDGRSDDLVRHPDGYVMHAWIAVAEIQEVPGIVQLQLVQHEVDRFHVRVVTRGEREWGELKREAIASLRAVLGAATRATIERVPAIPPEPSGKLKMVISHCV